MLVNGYAKIKKTIYARSLRSHQQIQLEKTVHLLAMVTFLSGEDTTAFGVM